jgi:hypothetical protein
MDREGIGMSEVRGASCQERAKVEASRGGEFDVSLALSTFALSRAGGGCPRRTPSRHR